ncbi:hypothetical protein PYW07_007429 [Mythimna separata]|uniref:Integrase catalytic domain-containing protein n=1 Tax=Mythimna separata TaxID=271217 RepID=A0AAD7Z3D6_MYTSE|nr:hypothetical protein PYW07_007429 [Mythimna separata]
MDKSRWVSGPDFLHLSEDAWPKFKPAENEEEIKPPTTILTVSEAIVLIDHTRFSNWRRLTRSFAYVLLFIDRCQRLDTRMSPVYERRSQTHIIRQTQCELFYDKIATIKNGNTIKPQSKLRKLNPRLDDDGVLRVQSRLIAGRELSLELKKPIILDARHNVTKLIIEYKHRLLGHFGTATLVNELRQDYYIFRLRAAVRSLIANCVICKARRARCEQPMMAGLPTMRLEHHCRPFTYCGVDMFGPMTETIGRRQEKRWGVIFTCMNTRAVHIEIASSLNTDSTLMAIRRMAARRGYPKQLHSDNGTNFRSANKELLKIDEEVINRTADLRPKLIINLI